MPFLENWPAKLAILVILAFVAGGAYYAMKAGEHMKLSKEMMVAVTEKYKAPTEDAYRKAYAELGIEWSPKRKLTTDELKQYLAKWEAEKQAKRGR